MESALNRIKNGLSRKQAFTFIEVLISILIMSLVGSMAWQTVYGVVHSEKMTDSRIQATNIMQKAQENLRWASQSFFNQLTDTTCNFLLGNTCGLDPTILNGFPVINGVPKYNINLNVTNQTGVNFKRVVMTVSWQEDNANRNISTVFLLARPGQPMPGNLLGLVTNAVSGAVLGNVNLTLTPQAGGAPTTVQSTGVTTSTVTTSGVMVVVNYDFRGQAGTFSINPGMYNLMATSTNYFSVTRNGITIISGQDTVLNLQMTPNPPPPPVCDNDSICEAGETCWGCPGDCGACPPPPPFCQGGGCNSSNGENCQNCPQDCGTCGGV